MNPYPKILLVGGPDVEARLELIHYLKRDFDISVLGSLPTLHNKFLVNGFDYYFYPLSRRVDPFLDLLTMGHLATLFRRLKPQIVHAFDTKPCIWARLTARWAKLPIVIGTLPGLGVLYTSESNKVRLIRFIYQQLQKAACHVSDLTIFQNHDDAHQFITAGIVSEQKSKVILGSGVSTDLFTQARISPKEQAVLKHSLGFQPDEIVVTMISRVIRSKGVVEFTTAAQRVNSVYPKARFLLVGPADKDSFDRLDATELDYLRKFVTWPGPRQDIPAILAISDIFVLPSAYREGIPRVLLEAASMALPLITTNSPGCNEVVEQGVNGFLTPVRDPAALTEAIIHLISCPKLRQQFGQISRQQVVERFDISVVADQIRSVYCELLTRKGAI